MASLTQRVCGFCSIRWPAIALAGLLTVVLGGASLEFRGRTSLLAQETPVAQTGVEQKDGQRDGAAENEPLDEAAIQQWTQRVEKALSKAGEDPEAARKLLAELPQPPPQPVISALREHDRAGVYKADAAGRALRREIYLVLGRVGDFRSLHYLYEAFEAQPSRRQDVAEALTQYAAKHGRRTEEWQILLRALPILDPDASRNVMASLATFPRRGSKPKWQREVLLAGLRLPAEEREVAVKLMEHWTGRKQASADKSPAERLEIWRTWFNETHPDLPPAQLAIDPPDAKHKYAELLNRIRTDLPKGDVARGSRLFDSALCAKCHRMGQRGEAMGPDLTSTPHRYQESEMLEALLFPSQSIADDYGAVAVETTAGQVHTGIVNAAAGKVTVLLANGEKVMLDREQVQRTMPVVKSAMPDGLLDKLTADEVVDLFAFLFHREKR
jgi:putative heme-binding domain-containing protein